MQILYNTIKHARHRQTQVPGIRKSRDAARQGKHPRPHNVLGQVEDGLRHVGLVSLVVHSLGWEARAPRERTGGEGGAGGVGGRERETLKYLLVNVLRDWHSTRNGVYD